VRWKILPPLNGHFFVVETVKHTVQIGYDSVAILELCKILYSANMSSKTTYVIRQAQV